MKVALRADASVDIGSGHVARCLTLADQLQRQGAETQFICRRLPGAMGEVITARGHSVTWLSGPQDTMADAQETGAALVGGGVWDWLVVDNYGLAADWERSLQGRVRHLLVIDDMANRSHDCDLLLDQNLQAPHRYGKWINPGCQALLGPGYALLRPAFHELRRPRDYMDGSVRSLLVFFGGSDASNETGKVLEVLATLDLPGIDIEVVVGGSNPLKDVIRERCTALSRCNFYCQVEDMAGLMAKADLALGATGGTTWERACLGLPTLAVSVADNQLEISRAADEAGLLTWLGQAHSVDANAWRNAIKHALSSPAVLQAQSQAGMALVDGQGAQRVAERMMDRMAA